jgi:hypothetical protein
MAIVHTLAEDLMTLQAHVSELVSKHQALEAELADAIAHPASSDAEIAEIKRRKLKIKDEITRLEAQPAAA